MPPSAADCVPAVANGSMRGRRTGGRSWSWARPARPAGPSPRPCSGGVSGPGRGAPGPGVRRPRGNDTRRRRPGDRARAGGGPRRRAGGLPPGPQRAPRRGRHRARVADAAAAAGPARLVFHSVLRPDDARMPHHLRKAEAEALLREALGERLTVLRPAAYHQNLLGQARSGMLAVPYSLDAPFTNVDLDDVARGGRGRPPRCPRRADPRPRRAGGAHDPADDRGGCGRPGPAGERHADVRWRSGWPGRAPR